MKIKNKSSDKRGTYSVDFPVGLIHSDLRPHTDFLFTKLLTLFISYLVCYVEDHPHESGFERFLDDNNKCILGKLQFEDEVEMPKIILHFCEYVYHHTSSDFISYADDPCYGCERESCYGCDIAEPEVYAERINNRDWD